jgi:uncharacterized protein YcfJ
MPQDTPTYDSAALERIQKNPLIIAVAGHANHGKTSTVQTLCRMPGWGEVRDLPGTTKKVSGVKFKIAGKTFMIVFDTPGFQNSTEAIEQCGDKFAIEDIRRFFQSRQDFSDDSKALEQVLKSHLVLYVVDVTLPPSENLKNDFRILACSGVPVIPLFNFSKDGNTEEYKAWIAFLHQHNYHLEVRYDAHYYRPEYEQRLNQTILILIKDSLHREFFNWYVIKRQSDERHMMQEAITAIAEMLVDCAAYRYDVTGVEPALKAESQRKANDYFEKQIAQRESKAFEDMVAAYKFKRDLLENAAGATDRECLWKHELFGKEIRQHLKIGVAAGAIGGALVFAAGDLAVGGISSGLFAASGAVVGAIAGALGAGFYNNTFDRSLNTVTVQCTEKTCRVLIERALLLLKDLQHRGLADQREFIVSDKALRVVKTDINHLVAELAEVSKKRALSLIGVDPAAVSKQILTERKSRLEKIEGLIEALAGKTEEATKAVGGLPAPS